jgi:LysM repeat protein
VLVFALGSLIPVAAAASSLFGWLPSAQIFSSSFLSPTSGTETSVLRAAINIDPNPAKGGADLAIAGGVALLSATGPEGTISDIEEQPTSTQISIYVVRNGDTLSTIAHMYGVSTNTILWANDLKSVDGIHPGDTLIILPVSGIEHVVAKGETLASIVKKYSADIQDVLDYNNLTAASPLAVGDTIIIPDGVDGPGVAPAQGSSGSGSAVTLGGSSPAGTAPGCVSNYERLIPGYGGPALPGYFIRPIAGGVKTQCLHGYNAVDLGTPRGTKVVAAADGIVIVARSSGYNGGYGEYIAIDHPNGTQTVYAHLSKIYVTSGQEVEQGQVIALSGNTGNSTGPHLHFEIRGAVNPF